MLQRPLTLAFTLLVCSAAAQGATIDALLERGPLPSPGQEARPVRTGLLVQDLTTDQRLLEVRADEAFRPASNIKLFPAATLLYTLGPAARLETRLVAPAAAEVLPRATFVGAGDPTLAATGEHSLADLALQVAQSGVRRIEELVIDDRLFTRPWVLPDNEILVSAVHLRDLTRPVPNVEVRDAGQFGQFEPWTPQKYTASVGRALAAELMRVGVVVTGEIRTGVARPEDRTIASVKSAPLAEVLARTLKPSNNVYAEHLFARAGVSGEVPSRPGLAREGIASFLARVGVDQRNVLLMDGSGLSRNDRLTPNSVVQLLRYAYLNPLGEGEKLSPFEAFKARKNPFVEALAVAGTGVNSPQAASNGGTLARRLVNSGLDVRAKTGTIIGASALSGYVVAKSGRVLAFSMLMDGYGGYGSELRNYQDELLRVIADTY